MSCLFGSQPNSWRTVLEFRGVCETTTRSSNHAGEPAPAENLAVLVLFFSAYALWSVVAQPLFSFAGHLDQPWRNSEGPPAAPPCENHRLSSQSIQVRGQAAFEAQESHPVGARRIHRDQHYVGSRSRRGQRASRQPSCAHQLANQKHGKKFSTVEFGIWGNGGMQGLLCNRRQPFFPLSRIPGRKISRKEKLCTVRLHNVAKVLPAASFPQKASICLLTASESCSMITATQEGMRVPLGRG
jgi:hypothetical protein